jgi:hypothetical protein
MVFDMSDKYVRAADEMSDLLWIFMQQVWVMKEVCGKQMFRENMELLFN